MSIVLKHFPIFRLLEDIDVRFPGGAWHRLKAKLLSDHAVIEFGLHRDRSGHITMNEVIDEMVRLAVFPILCANRERARPKWIPILLSERL